MRVKLRCLQETAPASYEGEADNYSFWFYFKHGQWSFTLYQWDDADEEMEGRIGHQEEDDMNELVAKSIIVYCLATITGNTEIEFVKDATDQGQEKPDASLQV